MKAELSDIFDSCFSLSLDLLGTLDLFSHTLASKSLVFCECEVVSDLVSCKYPLLPVIPGAGNDEGSRISL